MTVLHTIRSYLNRREHSKSTRHVLKQVRYFLNCRIDLLSPGQIEETRVIEAQCLTLQANPDAKPDLSSTIQTFQSLTTKAMGARRFPQVRENLEVIVVALSIALGFRTYFYQPFKIPTASMEDTLLGIHVDEIPANSLTARMGALKYATWIIDGVYVKEIRARENGVVGYQWGQDNSSGSDLVPIGNQIYKIPKLARLNVSRGQYVRKGDLIWRGTVKAGDHVFVDKMRWNFFPPKRGQVVVFRTDGINGLVPGIHYIKRLVGLPGEAITVSPPNVLVNGVTNGGCLQLEHVADKPGYQTRGFAPGQSTVDPVIDPATQSHRYQLPDDGYFCLGDNTGSSLDSRYWGAVPEANMVGPAVLVYWPFSSHWGLIGWPKNPPTEAKAQPE